MFCQPQFNARASILTTTLIKWILNIEEANNSHNIVAGYWKYGLLDNVFATFSYSYSLTFEEN